MASLLFRRNRNGTYNHQREVFILQVSVCATSNGMLNFLKGSTKTVIYPVSLYVIKYFFFFCLGKERPGTDIIYHLRIIGNHLLRLVQWSSWSFHSNWAFTASVTKSLDFFTTYTLFFRNPNSKSNQISQPARVNIWNDFLFSTRLRNWIVKWISLSNWTTKQKRFASISRIRVRRARFFS